MPFRASFKHKHSIHLAKRFRDITIFYNFILRKKYFGTAPTLKLNFGGCENKILISRIEISILEEKSERLQTKIKLS